ncbi:excinuclease ABC subunit UvrC [Patescibacteria group bacterium]|nr:excinuclease ABC subunit UvrC [Patescibacteria group bacterium]
MTETIKRKLKQLPTTPGVYLHKDAKGKILYVGKAKNLRNRVRSYFQEKADHDAKTRVMVSKAADVDWIVTSSEVEALLVESNFIKQYRPPYNVVLRDDKSYQFIKITDEQWPRVTTTRNTEDQKAKYFGPYTNGWAVKHTLKTLRRISPYCLPNDPCDDKNRGRPCLYYHLGLCPSPQHGKISAEDYQAHIDGISKVLNGQAEPVLKQLKSDMKSAATARNYEKAADFRDRIENLERLLEGQQAISSKSVNRDAIGLARDQGHAAVTLINVRAGRVVARKQFSFWGTGDASDTEVIDSFLGQYYKAATNLPDEIIVPFKTTNDKLVAAYLTERRASHHAGEKRSKKVKVSEPERGDRRKLLKLATDNAVEHLRQLRENWTADEKRTETALADLTKVLKLSDTPNRIECYDISTLSGTSTVGSMVVFLGGQPATAHYRRFQIRHVKGVNDFASLQEMLRRRFKRFAKAAEEANPTDASFATVPDILLIDGGKGQVSGVAKALDEFGVTDIPLLGLAKRFEDVYRYDPKTKKVEEVRLPKGSQGLYLLQRIRDEAHRFAITYGRKMSRQKGNRSALDDVPGIGPIKKKQLLKKFGSVTRMKQASLQELQVVIGDSAGRIVKENL